MRTVIAPAHNEFHFPTVQVYYWYWSYYVMFKEIKRNNKSILMYRRKRCVSYAHAQCAYKWTIYMYKIIVLLYIRAYLPIWMDEIRKSQRCMNIKFVILRKHAHASLYGYHCFIMWKIHNYVQHVKYKKKFHSPVFHDWSFIRVSVQYMYYTVYRHDFIEPSSLLGNNVFYSPPF